MDIYVNQLLTSNTPQKGSLRFWIIACSDMMLVVARYNLPVSDMHEVLALETPLCPRVADFLSPALEDDAAEP
jgi:hypothetical protein